MQGKEVDMEKLARQNELMPAIGNMKVNARGDELGPGGKIIRKREEVIAEYYEHTRPPVAPIKNDPPEVIPAELDESEDVVAPAEVKKKV
jgi:hypothetical protein